MSDFSGKEGEGMDKIAEGGERPLRWAPEESFEPQRPSASLPPGEPPPLSPPPLPSWEQLEEKGLLSALFLSIKEVLFQPAETFSRMPRRIALGRPLVFAVMLGTLGAMITLLYSLLHQAVPPLGETLGATPTEATFGEILERLGIPAIMPGPTEMLVWQIGWVAMAPIWIAIWAFVWSGIVHLLLMLLGGARHGYETTFRTLCYVKGATSMLALIPFCGAFPIAFVWAIVCSIIGLTHSQETSGGKAAAAVLVPYLFCCCCLTASVGPIVISLLRATFQRV